jgi:hypothetical protein
MNAYAIFAINDHLEFLLEEAAERRARDARKPRGRGRISSMVAAIRRSLDRPTANAESRGRIVTDHPFRS